MKNGIEKLNSKLIENLFLKISQNDEEAFHELYTLTKSSIYGYSLSILKNHEQSLDNMQEVFIKIYENIDSYKYQGKPMNWIFTITKSLALTKIRKQKKITISEIDENTLINPDISVEDKATIKILLESLSDEERQIIIMHLIGKLKHIEIANILEMKLSTVLSKYHRAIKKLKEEWR